MQLRRFLGELSPGKPWAACGRWPAGNGGVLVEKIAGRSRYGNLKNCGSRNVCATCHVYAREQQARAIKYAAGKWEDEGHGLVHVTLTFPHWAGLLLALLWPFVSKGIGRCMSGRQWRALKAEFGIRFDIRAIEATIGYNGWHPHVHLLIFTERPVVGEDMAVLSRLREHFLSYWGGWVAAHGFGQLDPEHGVVVKPADAGGADYVAKVQSGHWHIGRELAKGGTKLAASAHRTFFRVVADYREHGDPADLAIIREWEKVAPGKQMIRMSNGLRAWAGLDDLTDAELAAATGDGDEFDDRERTAVIPPESWRVVLADDVLFEGILDAADLDGLPGINALLAARRLAPAVRPPPGWRSGRGREGDP